MIDLSEARSLERTIQAVVEPQFVDAMGHMNVAWYVALFDRAVWVFFGRHGLDEEYRRTMNRGMFALEENVRYLSELRQGDALDVHTGVLEVRAKTVRLLQYMLDPKQQKVAATREVVAAHIDFDTRRSTPFPAEVAERLAAGAAPAAAMTEAAAQEFARAWIDAWNRQDVEAVLQHYAEHAVFVSPKAERFTGKARVEGKAALRAYWQTALSHSGTIRFTLEEALWSARAETLSVLYRSELGGQAPIRAAEIMRFRAAQIVRGEALYGAAFAPTDPA